MIWRWLAPITALVLLAGLWPLSKATGFQLFGTIIDRVATEQPLVALTFDDGPSAKHTQSVLAMLAAEDVTATFFLTGAETRANPALAAEIVAAGHEVGNHSYSHERLVLRTPAAIRTDLARTDAALRDAGAQGDIPFRPPYGQKLVVLPWVLAQADRPTIMWDVAPDDLSLTPGALATAVVESAQPGSIILMHVMYDSRTVARAALPDIISGLRGRGFEIVTVGALLAAGE